MAMWVEYSGFQGHGPHPDERAVREAATAIGLLLVTYQEGNRGDSRIIATFDVRTGPEIVAVITIHADTPEEVVAWLVRYGRGEVWA